MPKRKPLRFNNYSGALSGAFLGWWAFLSFFFLFLFPANAKLRL